jgi:hypothetical protein
MNKVILRGNLGDDPKFNTTNTNNVPVANFRMATNKKWTDANGQKQEATEWHNCVAWRRLAEIVRDYCRKGSQVLVEGQAKERKYSIVVQKQCTDEAGNVITNPQTGQPYTVNVVENRTVVEYHVDTIELLDKKPGTTAYPQAGTTPVVGAAGNPGAVNAQFVVPQQAQAGTPVPPVQAPPAETQNVQYQTQAATPVQPVVIPGI